MCGGKDCPMIPATLKHIHKGVAEILMRNHPYTRHEAHAEAWRLIGRVEQANHETDIGKLFLEAVKDVKADPSRGVAIDFGNAIAWKALGIEPTVTWEDAYGRFETSIPRFFTTV